MSGGRCLCPDREATACVLLPDPDGSAAAYAVVRSEIKRIDAALPVYEMKTLETQLDETLLTDRLIAMLSAGFGLLATLLASIGLYGVMAFVVARRRKELGIRIALGARRAVIWLVMREVLLLLVIGLAIGVPAAMGLGQLVATQLYGIQPHDLQVAAWTIALLGLVSAAAGSSRRTAPAGSIRSSRSGPNSQSRVGHPGRQRHWMV